MEKRFQLSPTSVEVVVERNNTVPCHPPAEDPLLVWLEEFVSRLRDGVYRPGILRTGESSTDKYSNSNWWSRQRMLWLCPNTASHGCSIAVTRGSVCCLDRKSVV